MHLHESNETQLYDYRFSLVKKKQLLYMVHNLPSYVTRYDGLLKHQQYIPFPSLSIDTFYIHCYRG